uniref:Uncharacterized protein n=1 Tax=Anguilla anguilla TaxID=7936 RepID=A0A0E9SIQ8_ANGAN
MQYCQQDSKKQVGCTK